VHCARNQLQKIVKQQPRLLSDWLPLQVQIVPLIDKQKPRFVPLIDKQKPRIVPLIDKQKPRIVPLIDSIWRS
jgi:hypothetical protein